MKTATIPIALAAITAAATPTDLKSKITSLSIEVILAADAIDTLKSHGFWAPDIDAFGRGYPNVDKINATAENLKFETSGLNLQDLVSVHVDGQAISTAVDGDKGAANTDVCAPYPDCCDRCHACEEACVSMILCLACWLICEGVCQGQSFCKNQGCD